MYTFTKEEITQKKTAILAGVLTVIVIGLYIFNLNVQFYEANSEYIKNFKPYYLKSYWDAYAYYFETHNVSSFLASIRENSRTANAETPAESIPVLLYHGIVSKPDGINLTLDKFGAQMYALKKAGYHTVTLSDFNKFIRGEKELPEKSFLLTFDDGRKDSYYPADPILKSLGYNAVMFVITKASLVNGSSYYLTAEELKDMLGSGRWELAAHARDSHSKYPVGPNGEEAMFLSSKLWLADEKRLETNAEFRQRVENEFNNAKNDLVSAFGIEPLAFAFPDGNYGQETANYPEAKDVDLALVRAIYPLSFYQTGQRRGFNQSSFGQNTPYIKRFDVNPSWDGNQIISVIEKSTAKDLPYHDEFDGDRGWVNTWGEYQIDNSNLIMQAKDNATGASAILDGTYLWRNYDFTTKVHWISGSNISLMGHYQDADNLISCNFTNAGVLVEEMLAGQYRVIRGIKQNENFVGQDITLGIRFNKDEVQCLVNGSPIATRFFLPPELDHGGIGIKVWDPNPNQAKAALEAIHVE